MFKMKRLLPLLFSLVLLFCSALPVQAADAEEFEFGTRYDLFSQIVTTPDLYIPDDTTIYTVSVPFTIPVFPSTSNSYRFRMEIWASQSCNNNFVSYWDEYRLSYGGMVYYPTVVNENTIVFDFVFDGGGHNTFTLFCDLHFNGNNELPESRDEWVFNSTVALDAYYYLFDLGVKVNGVAGEISGKADTIIGQNNEANAMQSEELEKLDDVMNGYDSGTGSAAKDKFDSAAAELEAAEDNLFSQSSYDQVDYHQFDSFFRIDQVVTAMLFVKSILESLYSALGIFGIPLTIGLVLLVFTRIIGFQNFYSGGD